MLLHDRHSHDVDVELHMIRKASGKVTFCIFATSEALGNRTIRTSDGKTALDCFYHPYAFKAGKHAS